MEKRPSRADLAIEAINRGLRSAEDITVEKGIEEAISNGRMSVEEGALCLNAFRRTRAGLPVSESLEASEEAASD